MQVGIGKFTAEKIVFEGLHIRVGDTVTILTREPENSLFVTAEEDAELQLGIEEAEWGETISAQELLERLKPVN